MKVSQGLGGPKAMAKAAANGQSVNIPTPEHFCEGRTEEKRKSALLVLRWEYKVLFTWKIR